MSAKYLDVTVEKIIVFLDVTQNKLVHRLGSYFFCNINMRKNNIIFTFLTSL